ncbi:MAG: protein kinase [Actinobacteria bacterium]|nr:protein kinase [Actinomycetota bacterium]
MTPAIADYTIRRELGPGGVGVSFLAAAPARLGGAGDPVVVRLVRAPRDDLRTVRRVLEHIAAAAAAHSDRLAPILDAGHDGPLVWVARPWFAAGTLAQHEGTLNRAERLRAVIDAARAAHALHEVGVAHRRITPRNVALAGDGSARLCDPGIGHVLVPGRTLTAAEAKTSLPWVDPAVLRGEAPSRSTDIWSLGVLLLHALGARPAGPAAPQVQVVAALRNPPPLPVELASQEARLVRSLTDPDPGRRPRTAAEVAELVQELLSAGRDAPAPGPPAPGPPGRDAPEGSEGPTGAALGPPPLPTTSFEPLPGELPEER